MGPSTSSSPKADEAVEDDAAEEDLPASGAEDGAVYSEAAAETPPGDAALVCALGSSLAIGAPDDGELVGHLGTSHRRRRRGPCRSATALFGQSGAVERRDDRRRAHHVRGRFRHICASTGARKRTRYRIDLGMSGDEGSERWARGAKGGLPTFRRNRFHEARKSVKFVAAGTI